MFQTQILLNKSFHYPDFQQSLRLSCIFVLVENFRIDFGIQLSEHKARIKLQRKPQRPQ